MPFTLIKGTFHVVHYQADGDSIRFLADDPANWTKLGGSALKLKPGECAQLRVEAIDTLETHYAPGGHGTTFHQPTEFAQAATLFLIDGLGIKNVKFGPAGREIVSADDGTHGYILARKTDCFNRPISFVFAGDARGADGAAVTLGPKGLERSLNFQAAAAGLAYPTYYEGLFPDLRRKITRAVTAARKANLGLWPQDKTITGAAVPDISAVTTNDVILPKLFRRIVDYLEQSGSIQGFKEHLAQHPERVTDVKTGHFTNLDTFVQVQGDQVRLTIEPERLVFRE